MFKKIILSLLVLLLLMGCKNTAEPQGDSPSQGCDIIEDCGDGTGSEENLGFKQAYEALNGTTNKKGAVNRSVEIPVDHPFVSIGSEDIAKMIENKETFYLYLGDELCPWCRSVIEKAIETAKKAGIELIYYLKVWDSEGSEIFRDRYVLEEGKPVLSVEADQVYYQLLDLCKDHLEDYTLKDEDGKEIAVGEKRIYVPTFIYFENGVVRKFVTGISDLQEESREELSPEILANEEAIFKEFFEIDNQKQ